PQLVRQAPQISTHHLPQHIPLVPIHSRLRRHGIPPASSLHLNKTQPLPIPPDQVDISPQLWVPPPPGHHGIAQLAQMKQRLPFSSFPGRQMRRQSPSTAPPRRKLVQPPHRPGLHIDPHCTHHPLVVYDFTQSSTSIRLLKLFLSDTVPPLLAQDPRPLKSQAPKARESGTSCQPS